MSNNTEALKLAAQRMERAFDWFVGRSAFTQTKELKGLAHAQKVREEAYAAHDALRAALAQAEQAQPTLDREATWWSLVMGAAASIEDAANCLRDPDAKRQAEGAAAHYRAAAQRLCAAPPAAPPAAPQPTGPLDDFGRPIVYDTEAIDNVTHALTGDEGEDDSVTVLERFAAYVQNVWPGKPALKVLLEYEEKTLAAAPQPARVDPLVTPASPAVSPENEEMQRALMRLAAAMGHPCVGGKRPATMESALVDLAAQRLAAAPQPQAAQQAAPEGWKLVPVEPTKAMHLAGVKAFFGGCHDENDFDKAYRAMLAAAPTQAAPPAIDRRKLCTCDGAGRGPGRKCVVKAGGRLGELWRCAEGIHAQEGATTPTAQEGAE